jgi:hypothetical protein
LTDGLGVTNSHALRIDDPQLPVNSFCVCEAKPSKNERFNGAKRLNGWAKNPDPGVTPRRVGSNIREVEIERDQNAPFGSASPNNGGVGRACELLLSDSVRVVAEADKRCMDELR